MKKWWITAAALFVMSVFLIGYAAPAVYSQNIEAIGCTGALEEQQFSLQGWLKYRTITGWGIWGPVWQTYNDTFKLGSLYSRTNWFKVEVPNIIEVNPKLAKPGICLEIPLGVIIHQGTKCKVGDYTLKATGFSVYLGIGFRDNIKFPKYLLRWIELQYSPIYTTEIVKNARYVELTIGGGYGGAVVEFKTGLEVEEQHNYTTKYEPTLHQSPELFGSYLGKFLLVGAWGSQSPNMAVYNNTIYFRYPKSPNTDVFTTSLMATFYLACDNLTDIEEYINHGLEFYILVQFGWWLVAPDGNKMARVVTTHAVILGDDFSPSSKFHYPSSHPWIRISQVKEDSWYVIEEGGYSATIFGGGADSYIYIRQARN